MSSFRRSGDGFMRCSDGHVRWGIFGAAGVLFVWRSRGIEGLADGTPLVMLQQRSAWAHEGGTWSCAGGALDEGETAYEGALREASEEVGEIPEAHRVLGEYVFAPATDWTYTTLVVEVDRHFGASVNFETDAVVWVPCDLVEHRPLHAGFAAAWPHLRAIVEAPAHEAPGVSDDAPN
ncbi:MAG: NUDIX hydrolase [Ilumatobacteraceae bacterium]|nr:NUDIX domain-containing protein [Ilumatobacter sp.]MCB0984690.1 NUDIX domain-containing protein [Ilumatobacter sp.]